MSLIGGRQINRKSKSKSKYIYIYIYKLYRPINIDSLWGIFEVPYFLILEQPTWQHCFSPSRAQVYDALL